MSPIAYGSEPVPEDEVSEEYTSPSGQGSTAREGLLLVTRFVRGQPTSFGLSLVGGIGWALMVVGATYILGRVTDEVIAPGFDGGVKGGTVLWAMLALSVVAVLRGLSVILRRWYGSVTETVNQAELRRQVSHRLLMMPLASYRRHQTGRLLANADVDVTTGTRLLMPLPFSLGVIALAVFSLISLLYADVTFALVALVLFPLLALLSRYYTHKVSGPAAEVQDRLGVVSSIAHESFDGALTVKTLGREQYENERFQAAAARVRSERLVVANMTSIFEPMIQLLPNMGMIALLLIGAWRVDGGTTSPGQLIQAVALFGWLAFPMRIVGFMFESLPMSVVSVRRVDRVLAEPESPAAEGIAGTDLGRATRVDKALSGGRLDLRVEGVSFSYENNGPESSSAEINSADRDSAGNSATGNSAASSGVGGDPTPVLHDVTFDVAAGEVVALVGSTGSGKTTLINLLLRLDEPDAGVIRLGGVPIHTLDPDVLRSAMAAAFQESFLFASSIKDNVSMGHPLDGHLIEDALERASADTFVSQLPHGVDTIVGERGITLSGGQRQRVALARALARQPRVLLLDDATSAVDPVIEAQILQRLRDGDTTMLIVAHRLSTILLADRVVHMENGRVRSEGTHAELLSDSDYVALVHAYEKVEAEYVDEPHGVQL